jgi:hypothetical protein
VGFGRISAVAVAVGALALPASGLAAKTVRLAVHSTTRTGTATVHDGASAVLDHASIKLALASSGQGATFTLVRADDGTGYTLGIKTFLHTGGTWLVPGAWVGSDASTVGLAIYPEGPGAGKAGAHNTTGDYARIAVFDEKSARKTATLAEVSAPLRVGRTTFSVTQFFKNDSCQVSVSGPQFKPSQLFGVLSGNPGNLLASTNGKQAFIVAVSNFRG